ncbi:hypothetical protein [Brevundimonas sp.]|uniref:hypothetical protein n=1 Tax=Brevundimonas sp. TaxID=1871086 RepID=UPI002D68380F|nr:hypothetical protein [Brevundimonas sp.]HYD28999.1 hypothetical protein [Brevundimonas sp.]
MISRLVPAIALAAFIVAAALALRHAEGAGWIGDEGARRAMQVLIGLMLAGYANMMPKQPGRPRGSPRAEAAAQAALRVGGWSMTLAALAYAGLWAFAPLNIANIASIVVVGGATALTLGYSVWAFMSCRRAGGASTGH